MSAATTPISFTGPGTPLTDAGFTAATARLGIAPPALWAVLAVETAGCGFLHDRRPAVLFERHVFSRLTNRRFDATSPDISQPTAGGYGPSGAHQHDRLAAAMQLDTAAALQSASWGLGQVMGENFAAAGFPSIQVMVAAMVGTEDAQLLAAADFIGHNAGMTSALRRQEWATFARLYNGPDYAAHQYDQRLQQHHQRYKTGPLPDLRVRAVQLYLAFAGFDPGAIDGASGPRTVTAMQAFQEVAGLPNSRQIDDALVSALRTWQAQTAAADASAVSGT